MGFTNQQLESFLNHFVTLFPLLRDERTIVDHWQSLVVQYQVQGKAAHDARLVAAMIRHGLTHLLSFNVGDFRRYRGIAVLTPDAVVSATQ